MYDLEWAAAAAAESTFNELYLPVYWMTLVST